MHLRDSRIFILAYVIQGTVKLFPAALQNLNGTEILRANIPGTFLSRVDCSVDELMQDCKTALTFTTSRINSSKPNHMRSPLKLHISVIVFSHLPSSNPLNGCGSLECLLFIYFFFFC